MVDAWTTSLLLDLRFLLPLGLYDGSFADPLPQTPPRHRYAQLFIQSPGG